MSNAARHLSARRQPPPLPGGRSADGTRRRLQRAIPDITSSRLERLAAFAATLRREGSLPLLTTGFALVSAQAAPLPWRLERRRVHWLYALAALIGTGAVVGAVWLGVQTLAPPADTGAPAMVAALAPPAAVPEQRAGARVYVVRAGDTLGAIAGRELGDPRRFGEIVALNSAVLADPDRVEIGTTLTLPLR